jgi:hypothetical protein
MLSLPPSAVGKFTDPVLQLRKQNGVHRSITFASPASLWEIVGDDGLIECSDQTGRSGLWPSITVAIFGEF